MPILTGGWLALLSCLLAGLDALVTVHVQWYVAIFRGRENSVAPPCLFFGACASKWMSLSSSLNGNLNGAKSIGVRQDRVRPVPILSKAQVTSAGGRGQRHTVVSVAILDQ